MEDKPRKLRQPGNVYQIFILVLTILSLATMALLLFPITEETRVLLTFYDNFICIIFLVDFTLNFLGAEKKSDYFLGERGWLDLLGSIPSFGITKYGGLLRLFRISRLLRITRLLSGQNKKQLVADVVKNRSQYAAFLTLLLVMIVLMVSSVLVLQFESASPNGSIRTGGDAIWYAIVTITTVGYGDFYPVTAGGRITGVFIMVAGIGIIGALASIFASLLVGQPPQPEEPKEPEPQAPIEHELAAIKNELAELRLLLEKTTTDSGNK